MGQILGQILGSALDTPGQLIELVQHVHRSHSGPRESGQDEQDDVVACCCDDQGRSGQGRTQNVERETLMISDDARRD